MNEEGWHRGLGDLSQHFEATQQGPLREQPAAPAASLELHGPSRGNNKNDAKANIGGSSLNSPAARRGTPGGSQQPCAPALASSGGGSAMRTPCERPHVQPVAEGHAPQQMPCGQLPVLATAGGHAPAQTPPGQLPAVAPAAVGGRAPARTPPGQLLQAASMLCRERLSTTPQPPANQPPAETSQPSGVPPFCNTPFNDCLWKKHAYQQISGTAAACQLDAQILMLQSLASGHASTPHDALCSAYVCSSLSAQLNGCQCLTLDRRPTRRMQ